jgi:hypothetical protein
MKPVGAEKERQKQIKMKKKVKKGKGNKKPNNNNFISTITKSSQCTGAYRY